jgi:hypothetical protein
MPMPSWRNYKALCNTWAQYAAETGGTFSEGPPYWFAEDLAARWSSSSGLNEAETLKAFEAMKNLKAAARLEWRTEGQHIVLTSLHDRFFGFAPTYEFYIAAEVQYRAIESFSLSATSKTLVSQAFVKNPLVGAIGAGIMRMAKWDKVWDDIKKAVPSSIESSTVTAGIEQLDEHYHLTASEKAKTILGDDEFANGICSVGKFFSFSASGNPALPEGNYNQSTLMFYEVNALSFADLGRPKQFLELVVRTLCDDKLVERQIVHPKS